MNKILPWIQEITYFVCAYKESMPTYIRDKVMHELPLCKNIAVERVNYCNDLVDLCSRADFTMNVSKY